MNARCLFLLLGTLAGPLHAAVFNVTRTDDPLPDACLKTDCSLREAINAANAWPGRDTVQLQAATYNLVRIDLSPGSPSPDNGPLWVTETLIVDGAGMGATRVRWNSPYRFFNQVFWTDDSTAGVSLTLREFTISGGRGSQGGCIHVLSMPPQKRHRLTLENTRVEGCSASAGGGAAYLHFSDLSLRGAQLSDNSTANHGGALELRGPVGIDSQASILRANHAGQDGGALRIWGSGLVGIHSDVVWVDDGSSVISDNSAAGDGGAIALRDTATLDLSTRDTAPPGQLLRIENNVAAGRGGGLRLNSGLTVISSTNRVQRVRLTGNTAASGGGIHASTSLHLSASELAGNHATAGAGGGLAFAGAVEWMGGRSLERVSLHGNTALASGGGAISSECASFRASDVSMHLNRAADARGQAIETSGPAQLRHVTLYGNDSAPAPGAPGLYKRYDSNCGDTRVSYANSLIADYCASMVATQLASEGGNQLGVHAAACPLLAGADELQSGADPFLLGFGDFGGDFAVVGWASDANPRPQRDYGLASWCTATDVRGVPRADGFCDAGAFEQP